MGEAGGFGVTLAEDDQRACDLAETALDTEWTGEATDALAEHLGRRPTREEIAEARTAYASRVTELLDIMQAKAVRRDFLDTLDVHAWCANVKPGTYLAKYIDGESDPGSRAGTSDEMVDRVRKMLRDRDLTLKADDRGLRVSARDE